MSKHYIDIHAKRHIILRKTSMAAWAADAYFCNQKNKKGQKYEFKAVNMLNSGNKFTSIETYSAFYTEDRSHG